MGSGLGWNFRTGVLENAPAYNSDRSSFEPAFPLLYKGCMYFDELVRDAFQNLVWR